MNFKTSNSIYRRVTGSADSTSNAFVFDRVNTVIPIPCFGSLHWYHYIATLVLTTILIHNLVCRENKEGCWTHLSSIRAGAGTGRYPLSLVVEIVVIPKLSLSLILVAGKR